MFLHELIPPKGAHKKRKIVGRGPSSGHGKTSGRGHKGQRARSGRGILPGLEGGQVPLIRRIPKLGFRSKCPTVYQIVNVDRLNVFENGSTINEEILKNNGFIKSLHKPVKILGDGDITKSLVIKIKNVSKTAHQKIIQAGGKFQE